VIRWLIFPKDRNEKKIKIGILVEIGIRIEVGTKTG
jgi:hypothetical protein